jgi:hypothetical protein
MTTVRLRLTGAGRNMSETMFPLGAPFFLRTWGTSRFPTPLHAHRPGAGL